MRFRFEDFPVKFLLVGLFATCLIAFAISLAVENGFTDSFVLDSRIPYSSISDQVNTTSAKSSLWKDGMTGENVQQESGLLVIKSIWGIMKSILNSFLILPILILRMMQDVFGIPPIISSTIIAIFTIMIIFAMWRVLKGAD